MTPNPCETPNGCDDPDCPRCREEWIFASALMKIDEEVRMLGFARAQIGCDS